MSFVASYVGLWLLTVFLTLIAIGLLREITVLKRSLGEQGFAMEAPLVIGSRAPNFSAVRVGSGRKESGDILRGRASLVVFISPQCATCLRLVHRLQSVPGVDFFSVVTVCKGNDNDCSGFLDPLGSGAALLLDTDGEVAKLYGVSGYPAVVVVDADRRVRGYGQPGDTRAFEELVERALRELNSKANSVQPAMK